MRKSGSKFSILEDLLDEKIRAVVSELATIVVSQTIVEHIRRVTGLGDILCSLGRVSHELAELRKDGKRRLTKHSKQLVVGYLLHRYPSPFGSKEEISFLQDVSRIRFD